MLIKFQLISSDGKVVYECVERASDFHGIALPGSFTDAGLKITGWDYSPWIAQVKP